MLFVHLLAMTATAAPVEEGVQLAVFPDGADFAGHFMEGQVFDVALDEVALEYGCYDTLGVLDFNLNVPVESMSIDLLSQEISVTVTFGTILGEDMVLFGEDEDWFDVCPAFTTNFRYAQVDDLVIKLALLPSIEDGDLSLSLARDVIATGSLHTDIEWVPDALILPLVEDMIWETLEQTATEMIPDMVASYWDKDMISGSVFDFDLSARLDNANISAQALQMGATLEANWTGSSQCSIANHEPEDHGRSPSLDFGNGNGADLGIGITEGQLNQLFRQAWSDGFLCFPEDRMDLVFEMVRPLIDPEVGGLAPSAIFSEIPVLSIDSGRATAMFPSLKLEIRGEIDGREVELVALDADLNTTVEIGLEPALTALTMTVHDLDLSFKYLRADYLLSDTEEATEHLKAFLRNWVADWVSSQVQGLALFATQFHFLDTTIRLDDISYEDGAMKMFIKLYDEDDPDVDRLPPDTSVELLYTNPQTRQAIIGLGGVDDREGPLAYAVQLNGEGWSSWQLEDSFVIEDSWHSDVLVEVIARDNWLNVDPSPASFIVNLNDPFDGTGEELRGCGCSGSPSPRNGFMGLFVALTALAYRRR
ncbi:MAG: hypothetical protein VX519_02795 [Myxococcota bacterium]|nr:hypothetical protein [Myxococcota bacterium]